jgi:cell shape-determining protein MreC
MYGLNRYVCQVLEEMRTCTKTLNFALIPSLVEEVQTMVNRMEMALGDLKDLQELKNEISTKNKELKKINKELEEKKAKNEPN